MKLFFNFFLFGILFCSNVLAETNNSLSNSKKPEIISSIKPIDSLVRMIVSESEQSNVDLLINGNQSPHGFSMKPSDVKRLNKAKIIFYIDDSFEEFLPKILETFPNIIKINLVKQSNLRFFKVRDIESWKKEVAIRGDKNIDYHVWLDTKNAKAILLTIRDELSKLYPENSAIYEANYKLSVKKIDSLFEDIRDHLKGLEKEKFIVFHDGFQYFEAQFKLNNIGYITKNPHYNVSIKSIKQNMIKAKDEEVKCVFYEHQFPQKFSNMVAKSAKAQVLPLDPIGFDIKPSKHLYFDVMRNASKTFSDCLRASSAKSSKF